MTLSFNLLYISLILIMHSLQQYFYDLYLYNLYFNVFITVKRFKLL